MLKTFRIFLAILSIIAVTLLFVDFTGTARSLWPWMAKIQFMPAVLSVNVLAIAVIVAMTLIFGRIYCSVICPLGIFQDVVNWFRGHIGSKRARRNRFRFVAAHTKLRLTVLTVFVVFVVIGLVQALAASIAGLIEPYSAYGRIASQIFAPAYDGINNLLASWSESQVDNYMFYRVTAAVSIPVLAVAIITLVTVVIFAWRGGRDYCNTICPVGTILGYLAKYSLLKPVINTDKCINCGKCGRNCKAKCIDTKHHDIDYSRCVACMDCINVCSEAAISYTIRRAKPETSKPAADAQVSAGRRAFMFGAGMLAGSAAMDTLAKVTDGGMTPLKDKKPIRRGVNVLPAGAVSHKHLSQHCTACQLCIQSCPNHVLKPSTSLESFMQPVVDYTDGFCDPSCTVCSNICPVGAFHAVDEVEKSSIQVGVAVVDLDACISASEGVKCGNCARKCPAGAISMVPVKENAPEGPRMPVVNDSACIGCGKCEYYCPVGTVSDMKSDTSAIHVEGIEVHREI